MKGFIILDHYLTGTYQTNHLTKDDLVNVKNGYSKGVIDIDNSKIFDVDKNEWVEIKTV